ncbi:MAG TPA: hypothetical protein VGG75_08770 [Trebonia sp.]|jgi:hypothetical protein
MAKETRKALNQPLPEMTGDYARDIALLITEIDSLRSQAYRARLRAANLVAAIHAALSAQEDGETDPFYFLRDEITCGRGGAYGA